MELDFFQHLTIIIITITTIPIFTNIINQTTHTDLSPTCILSILYYFYFGLFYSLLFLFYEITNLFFFYYYYQFLNQPITNGVIFELMTWFFWNSHPPSLISWHEQTNILLITHFFTTVLLF